MDKIYRSLCVTIDAPIDDRYSCQCVYEKKGYQKRRKYIEVFGKKSVVESIIDIILNTVRAILF